MITKLLQTTLPVVDEQKLIQTTDSLRTVTEEFVNVLKTDPHTAVTQLVHSAIEFGLKVVAAIIIYVIGLWLIKRVKKMMYPYFRGAIDKDQFHFTNEITPIGVAFYIAPLINATTRVGTQEEKLMLFESMLDFRGYELVPSTKRGCKGQAETRVEQACRNCTNIKSRQTKIRDNSLEKIE